MKPASEVAAEFVYRWPPSGGDDVVAENELTAAIEQARVEGAQMMAAYVYYRAQQAVDLRAVLSGVVDGVNFIEVLNKEQAERRRSILGDKARHAA